MNARILRRKWVNYDAGCLPHAMAVIRIQAAAHHNLANELTLPSC